MRARYVLPPLSVAALLLTGCVDNSLPEMTGADARVATVTVNAEAAALLPADVAGSGVLAIGTAPNYAPNEFKNSDGQAVGWDLELARGVAAALGLDSVVYDASFDNIVPSVRGGKFDIGASSFTDTVEREKQLDFVHYYDAGVQWAAPAESTVDPEDACGLKVAVQATTFQDTTEIPEKSAACVAAGKPAIEKMLFDSQGNAINAVVLGQADAFSADSPVALYAISKLNGKLKPVGETFDVAPYGFAVAKGSGMAEAVQLALQGMIEDGSYGAILDAWGVGAGGLEQIRINAAGADAAATS
ncbi:ABC transporter substrate-binding protein [Microterricola viridarii]|uniref:Polar amino acid transport system substrate-binding protein n=1 Tax=Microterricola viridarii TaxID=412690 RepID=A0A1H1LAY1_9MICO|nr:ABC transporter substrate-binding protein [Microterricola viridarii]SDR71587.1 polar amino acid transport system substrate-binding protein [Microterricola viridarii]